MENGKWFIEFSFIISGTFVISSRYISHHVNNYQKYVDLCEKNTEKFEDVYAKENPKDFFEAYIKANNCRKAIKIQSNDSLYYERGIALEYMGLHEKARKDFIKSLNWNHNNYKSQFFLGYVTEIQGNEQQALIEYSKAVELNPKFDQALYRKALMKHHLKNWEDAFKDYEKVIAVNPNHANALLNRGFVAEQFKTPEEIIQLYTKAIKANPKDYRPYFNRGTIKKKNNDFQGAVDDYTIAINLNPNEKDLYYNRAEAYIKLSNYEMAKEDFTRYIELNPYEYSAYYNRAVTKENLYDYEGAIKDYEKSVSIKPTAGAYSSICLLRGVLNEEDKIQKDCTKAIEYNPYDANAYNNRGYSKQLEGDYEGAMKDYAKALSIDPSHQKARENIEILSNKMR